MGNWSIRKTTPTNEQHLCQVCNKRLQKKTSKGTFNADCSTCRNKRYGTFFPKRDKRHVYRKHLKDRCDICGFIPEHECQLDIDHINGIHEDNREENLQTLCANCHRLKTFREKDWEAKKPQEY